MIEMEEKDIKEIRKECPTKPVEIKSFLIKVEERGEYILAVLKGPFSLNGYVGVPKKHPAYKKWYDVVKVDAPGGLTYCGLWKEYPKHFFLGFDHAHSWDEGKIITKEMVWEEVLQLFKDLKAYKVGGE